MRVKKQKNQWQIEAAAKFSVGLGSVCLILFMFVGAELGAKLRGMAVGLILLGWGSGQLVLANKRKKHHSEYTGKGNVNQELQVEDGRLEKQLEKLEFHGSKITSDAG